MLQVRLFVQRLLDYTSKPTQVPFSSVSFTEGVSRDVGWTAVLDGETVRDMGLDLRPWRSAVYLQVGDWLIGGFTSPRTYDRTDQTLAGKVTSRGGGWVGYLAKRHYYRNVTYTTAEQYDIVADVLSWVQTNASASPGGAGDIGLQLVREPTNTGRTRDRQYFDHDVKQVRELIEDLAEVDDGFDWLPAASWPAGQSWPVRQLRLGYPVIGANPTNRLVIADGDGCTIDREDYDGDQVVTRAHATGQATDTDTTARPFSTNTAADLDGLPILEEVESHDTTANPATLAKHAARLVGRGRAYRSVSISVLDIDRYPPELTRPGDHVDVVGDHPAMSSPVGDAQPWRIVSRTVSADEQGLARQTLDVMRADQLAVPGPVWVRRREMRAYRLAQKLKRAEELRQKVGRPNS